MRDTSRRSAPTSRPDRLNDLLALLAVLMIEAGGGLSLAIGMALSGSVRVASALPADLPARSDTSDTRPAEVVGIRPLVGQRDPDRPTEVTGTLRTVRQVGVRAPVQAAGCDVLAWLATAGGTTEGVRRLAQVLGRPRSTVFDECRRLAAAGHLTMTRGRRGTVLTLADHLKLN